MSSAHNRCSTLYVRLSTDLRDDSIAWMHLQGVGGPGFGSADAEALQLQQPAMLGVVPLLLLRL